MPLHSGSITGLQEQPCIEYIAVTQRGGDQGMNYEQGLLMQDRVQLATRQICAKALLPWLPPEQELQVKGTFKLRTSSVQSSAAHPLSPSGLCRHNHSREILIKEMENPWLEEMLKPKVLSSVMVVLTPILCHSALHSLQTSRQNLYCITLSDRAHR